MLQVCKLRKKTTWKILGLVLRFLLGLVGQVGYSVDIFEMSLYKKTTSNNEL